VVTDVFKLSNYYPKSPEKGPPVRHLPTFVSFPFYVVCTAPANHFSLLGHHRRHRSMMPGTFFTSPSFTGTKP